MEKQTKIRKEKKKKTRMALAFLYLIPVMVYNNIDLTLCMYIEEIELERNWNARL